jgi:hypothetical protein
MRYGHIEGCERADFGSPEQRARGAARITWTAMRRTRTCRLDWLWTICTIAIGSRTFSITQDWAPTVTFDYSFGG